MHKKIKITRESLSDIIRPTDFLHMTSNLLYEGLIKTNALDVIDNIVNKKYDAKFYYEKNYFTISYKFNSDIIDAGKELDKMLQLTGNLGWFPSLISTPQNSIKFSRKNFESQIKNKHLSIIVVFEAIYDNPAEIPPVLYHVSKLRYLDKILHKGLEPRHQDKLSSHPDRIYFTKTEKTTDFFIRKIFQITEEQDREPLVIIKFETDCMKQQFRLFRDPNFLIGKDYVAFFTMDSIYGGCLSHTETIYPLI